MRDTTCDTWQWHEASSFLHAMCAWEVNGHYKETSSSLLVRWPCICCPLCITLTWCASFSCLRGLSCLGRPTAYACIIITSLSLSLSRRNSKIIIVHATQCGINGNNEADIGCIFYGSLTMRKVSCANAHPEPPYPNGTHMSATMCAPRSWLHQTAALWCCSY